MLVVAWRGACCRHQRRRIFARRMQQRPALQQQLLRLLRVARVSRSLSRRASSVRPQRAAPRRVALSVPCLSIAGRRRHRRRSRSHSAFTCGCCRLQVLVAPSLTPPCPASHPIAAPRVSRRPLTSQRCRSDVTRHSGSSAFAACGSCSRAFWDRKHCQKKKKTLLEIRCSAAAYGGDLVDVPAASLVATRMSSATP